MLNLDLKKIINKNILSIILFGSYARGEETKNSDIDLLIITDKKVDTKKMEDKLKEINLKISSLIFTKEEFKKKIYEFNHQLLEIFYWGKVLFEKDKKFLKLENLYLALYHKKNFVLKFRNRSLSMKKLINKKCFV
jgi:predicted nucleotidyltransferase